MDRYREAQIGVIVQYMDGHLFAPGDYSHISVYGRRGAEIKRWNEPIQQLHFQNGHDAIVAGEPKSANGRIRESHVSTALCHVDNVLHRLGEACSADDVSQAILSNDLLCNAFDRISGHLRAYSVDVDAKPGILKLGPWLEVDPNTEVFRDTPAASELRSREYRAGFEIKGNWQEA